MPKNQNEKVLPPLWSRALSTVINYCFYEFVGGPKHLKLCWLINSQKISTAFFIFYLMHVFNDYSPSAWVYLALHGTYGYCWMIKHFAFPNKGFEPPTTYPAAFFVILPFLYSYWLIPYMFFTVNASQGPASSERMALAIAIHTVGITIMIAADAQTHFMLKYNPGHLITNGMNRYIRNPAYTGEMLIYLAYAIASRHWGAYLLCFCVDLFIFTTRCYEKEHSISRYDGWREYVAQAGMFVPWLPAMLFGSELETNKKAD